MNPSYRRGLSIVAGTIAWAAVLQLSWALLGPAKPAARSARDLAGTAPPLAPFHFTERSGREINDADLADKVWIAGFIFTRCPSSCPKITATMKSLEGSLDGTGVRLASLSVDPDRDTPEVLDKYARSFDADPERWLFLTGPRAETYDLIIKRFLLPVSAATAEELANGSEAVLHSQHLALVDRGNRPVGHYSASDPEAVKELLARAIRLDAQGGRGWAHRLPPVNASLNSLCAVLLLAGWGFIRNGKTRPHIACMVSAVVVSAIFLACYLVYHFQVGSVPFRGVGPIRSVYFTILLSHTVLAAAMVPMIVLTLVRGARGQYEAHTRIARLTFPIWVYVSITGVVIYLLLYQLPVSGPAAGA